MAERIIDNVRGVDPATKETINETKEDTTNIQDQLLILMGAVADLYEVVIGGDEV